MNEGGGQFGAPCGACKHLRKMCTPGCIFAPYFPSGDASSDHIFAKLLQVYNDKHIEELLRKLPNVEDPTPIHMTCHMPVVNALMDELRDCQSRINVLHGLLAFVLFLGQMRLIYSHHHALRTLLSFSRRSSHELPLRQEMINHVAGDEKGKTKQLGFDLNKDSNS